MIDEFECYQFAGGTREGWARALANGLTKLELCKEFYLSQSQRQLTEYLTPS